jgi:hypothetical protein
MIHEKEKDKRAPGEEYRGGDKKKKERNKRDNLRDKVVFPKCRCCDFLSHTRGDKLVLCVDHE